MSTAAQQAWYARNRERLADERQETRRKVLCSYGGRCTCCGVDNLEFLTIEHPNNDGAEDRRRRKARGNALYRQLLVDPDPELTVLCWNCNMARGLYGTCPHVMEDV